MWPGLKVGSSYCTFFINGLLEAGGKDGDDPVIMAEDVDEGRGKFSMVVLAHLRQDLNSCELIAQDQLRECEYMCEYTA